MVSSIETLLKKSESFRLIRTFSSFFADVLGAEDLALEKRFFVAIICSSVCDYNTKV